MDQETPQPDTAAVRPRRTVWRVIGTVAVVLVGGYLLLAGWALTALNCDGGVLGFDECSDAQRLGYIGLSLSGLAGMPLGIWLMAQPAPVTAQPISTFGPEGS